MRRHLPRATRTPGSPGRDTEQRLVARISELELRLKLLEARVRTAGADSKPARATAEAEPQVQARKPRTPRRRPRCPGCLLELPPGRRGESCVWCGFRFEAVGRAFR